MKSNYNFNAYNNQIIILVNIIVGYFYSFFNGKLEVMFRKRKISSSNNIFILWCPIFDKYFFLFTITFF